MRHPSTQRKAGREAARPAPPAEAAPAARPPALEWGCRLAPFAALLALVFSLRGAPLGTPVADDFEFLHRLRFHYGLDPFGSMGATYYWRPVSRQLWFGLVGPWLDSAPLLGAALNLALVTALAFVLYRIARRWWPAALAALVATTPLLSEPVRSLVTWPSGVQHLLATLALALAFHESLAGRRPTAALAALVAALSHELGVLAFPALVLGGALRGGAKAARVDAALAAALFAAWLAGYGVAGAHGVVLPPGGIARTASGFPHALALALVAASNAEGLSLAVAAGAPVCALAVLGIALTSLLGPAPRARVRASGRAIALVLAVGALAIVPLGALLPDWNAWRAFVPVTAIALAATLFAVAAHPAIGLAFVGVRLVAMLAAEPSGVLDIQPPPSASDLSFRRLTRLQTTVSETGQTLKNTKLPPRAWVAYWGLPQMTLNGFRESLAVQYWLRDTTARFGAFEGTFRPETLPAKVLAYDLRPDYDLVVPVAREALVAWTLGHAAVTDKRVAEAEAEYRRALALQDPPAPSLTAQASHGLAILAINRGEIGRADSLIASAEAVRGPTPDAFALRAKLAEMVGDIPRARAALRECLTMDPNNELAKQIGPQIEMSARELAERAAEPR